MKKGRKKMLKRFLLTTSVVVLVGGAGLAFVPSAKAQWYASVNAGVTLVDDADVTDTASIGSITGEVGFDTGFGLSGAVGYSWGGLRLEGEISYRKNDLEDLRVDSLTLGGTTFSGALGTFALEGDTTALGGMANGWYDFDTGTRWVPFLGAGLGVARLNIEIESIAGGAIIYDESDTVFAYQAGAGVGYKVTRTTTVSLSYRFFGTADPEFDDGFDKVDAEYSSHNIMVGIVGRF